MNREIIYEIKALYRDDFRVTGYSFGEGESSICILGSLRGNEYQQIYESLCIVVNFPSVNEYFHSINS